MCAGGITNNAYIFFVGMLMAQFTFTGYDACALIPALADLNCIAQLACFLFTAALLSASQQNHIIILVHPGDAI